MNPEQQRIAIAEACGWKDIDPPFPLMWMPTGKHPRDGTRDSVPDYLNDLNAMHEAEKTLKLEQHREYNDQLQKFCWYPAFCNAAQRAEAFLKTLNLWEGNDKL